MKLKIALILLFVVSLTTVTHAGRNYGAAGCGLGSMAMGADGNQFLAMIIDDALFLGYVPGAVGSIGGMVASVKTYAITTGTSNCRDDGMALKDKEQQQYVEENYESLMQEMAQGSGEHLFAFQSILECDMGDGSEFSAVMQQNYESIFPSSQTEPVKVLKSVKSAIKKNESLIKSCKLEEV